MHAPLADHGVPVLLGTLTRRVDWTEPPAEGEWELVIAEAGGDVE